MLTEAYYPTVDKANLRLLNLLVTDGRVLERESADTDHRVDVIARDVLAFRQTNTSRSRRYRIVRETFTDPVHQSIVIHVRFEPTGSPLKVYVYVDPAVDNSGLHDTADVGADVLVAAQGNVSMAVASSTGFGEKSCGFVGVNDGVADLRSSGRLAQHFDRAADGNVAEVAEIVQTATAAPLDFVLAVGFGSSAEGAVAEARATLAQPAEAIFQAYAAGWRDYVARLEPVDPPYTDEYRDVGDGPPRTRTRRSAGRSSPSMTIPWGNEVDAGKGNVGGYHLVWARDLYEVATALVAVGDRDAAARALDYLFGVQQKPDGSFPQNSWLDGRPYWGSLQLDEVSYPLVLAQQIGRTDAASYRDHVRPAAEFIVAHGPATPQERWEEESGYSPSTIAAEVAGLVCAAAIAERNGDGDAAARYRRTADTWMQQLDAWTMTRTVQLSPDPSSCASRSTANPTAASRSRSTTAAGRGTSGSSSTPASSNSCDSASDRRPIGASPRRSESSTGQSRWPPPRVRGGTDTTTTATVRKQTGAAGTRPAWDASGRFSPVSAASSKRRAGPMRGRCSTRC